MKKKLTAMVLALGAMFGAFEADAALAGNGTKADPYRIGSYGDLVAFAAKVNGGETNACAVLTADITATDAAWTPIGNESRNYIGTFDGQEHAIAHLSNASVSSAPEYVGFFGVIGPNGIVRNVKLVNVNLAAPLYGPAHDEYGEGTGSGGVVGYNSSGAVKNCSVSGVVKDGCYSGGVVGLNSGTVVNCCNAGNVSGVVAGGIACYNIAGTVENNYNTGNVSGRIAGGGIVGASCGDYKLLIRGVVKNCLNAGAVEVIDSDADEDTVEAGGVVGLNGECGTVENCCNTASVTGGKYVGGVVGFNVSDSGEKTEAKVFHCYALDSIAGGVAIGKNDGGYEVVDVRALSAAEFRVQSNFTGWDFKKVWKMGENAPKLRTGYDVTYDENWAGGAKTKKELDAGDGVLANAPVDPKREGWCFYGWLTAPDGGETVTDETVVSGEATYYAHWGRPVATFAAGAVSSSESKTVKLTVYGGSFTGPSSVKVFMTYQTAAAADLDFANATVNGVKVKGGLKFPLTLAWDTADVTPYVIEIPLKGDKTVEDDETLTFQLADVIGTEMGETDVCTVTVEDPAFGELRGRIETGTATKAESNNWIKVSHDGIPYFCGLADPADGGKVTGSGYCPEGKKVTLKASANKGFSFVGWTTNAARSASAPYPEGYFVATTASLVIDRTAKPAKDTKTSMTISNLTESTTFYAVFEGDPRVTATPVEFTNECGVVASAGGKVTGAGRYAPGKKVTLKATANKGYVFGGWYEIGKREQGIGNSDEDGLLSQEASFIFEMGEEDVDLYARFVTAGEDAESIAFAFNGNAMSAAGSPNPPYQTNVWCGVYLAWPLASSALSQTAIKVTGLPAGLKFTAKPVTSKVGSGKTAVTVTNVPANTIYGAPTAASKTDKNGNVTPSKVVFTVTTAGKSSQTFAINLYIDPLPDWAVGTFDGAVRSYPSGLAATSPVSGEVPCGTVSLTVDAKGKISGKLLRADGTWTLSAGEFSRVERVEDVEDGVVFHATVIGKNGKLLETNEVTVAAGTRDACPYRCGVVTGGPSSISAAAGTEAGPPTWTAYQNLWKRADTKAAQPVFKASFDRAVELGKEGDANNKLTLTFKKDGAVAFAGKVGGASVSGASQLVWVSGALGETALPDGWYVTIYAPPKPTAKPPFDGFCVTLAVELTPNEQNVVTEVTVGLNDGGDGGDGGSN